MPKMKTKKAIKARFKVTGTGKLVRHKQGHGHLLTKKTSKRKRKLRKSVVLTTAHENKYKNLMQG